MSTVNELATTEKSSQESDAATRSGSNEKEINIERDSVRGDQEHPTTADAQKSPEIDDAKSFLIYDERRWCVWHDP
jgi:hypothetical protein